MFHFNSDRIYLLIFTEKKVNCHWQKGIYKEQKKNVTVKEQIAQSAEDLPNNRKIQVQVPVVPRFSKEGFYKFKKLMYRNNKKDNI